MLTLPAVAVTEIDLAPKRIFPAGSEHVPEPVPDVFPDILDAVKVTVPDPFITVAVFAGTDVDEKLCNIYTTQFKNDNKKL